jgi:hypothetical protein
MREVNLFTFNGGEPFMHPRLVDLIIHCQRYIDRIEKFEVITNGTTVPNARLLKSLKFSDKVDVLVDNYGSDLSRNVAQIESALQNAGIRYRIRKYYGENTYMKGWVDTIDFSQKDRTQKDIHEHFLRCNYTNVFKNHFFIFEDTAHICYVNHKLLDWVNDDGTQYVNMQDNSLTVEQLREKLLSLRSRDFLTACTNCNGFITDGKRFAPAEQL